MVGRLQDLDALSLALFLLCLPLSGCVGAESPHESVPVDSAPGDVSHATSLGAAGNRAVYGGDGAMSEALRLMGAGDYEKASQALNRALFYRIDSSSYQFLNGLNYHLMSTQDVSLRPLAAQGYRQAIRFDGANWLAHYFLGVLEAGMRNHPAALEHLAEAHLLSPRNLQVMMDLAVGAYYAGEPEIAAALFARLAEVDAASVAHRSNYAMALAAAGRGGAALEIAREIGPGAVGDELVHRITRWRRYHDSLRPCAPQADGGPAEARIDCPASTAADSFGGSVAAVGGTLPLPGIVRAQFFDPGDQYSRSSRRYGRSGTGLGSVPMTEWPEPRSDRMVLLDVAILHTESYASERRGVNLLDGLRAHFGYDYRKTSVAGDASRQDSSRVIVRNLSASGLDYTLNIANALDIRNEILARPSLIATDGVPSSFFSGINVNAAAVGSGAYGAVLNIEKDIGVVVTLLPEFLTEDRVKLSISAERSDLALHDSSSIGFDLRIDTIKTTVHTEVVANLGETIILSGLVDRLREQLASRVPIIGRIPVLNWFLSDRRSIDVQNSVLMLVTPRGSEWTRGVSEEVAQSALEVLRERHPEWFEEGHTPAAARLRELRGPQFHRLIRAGDVGYGARGPDGVRNRMRALLLATHERAGSAGNG